MHDAMYVNFQAAEPLADKPAISVYFSVQALNFLFVRANSFNLQSAERNIY